MYIGIAFVILCGKNGSKMSPVKYEAGYYKILDEENKLATFHLINHPH